ncbi:MAG: hypothetical protein V4649_05295 [Bacteroidota bacterium]
MRNLLSFTALAFYAAIIAGCGRNNDYTPGYDHTSGMIKTFHWTGTTTGYYKSDSIIKDVHGADSAVIKWPRHYSRLILDTTIPIVKINDFAVSFMGALLRYKSTDSSLQQVRYDTTFSGAPITSMIFYYAKDSVKYEYHKIDEYHAPTGHNYQEHWDLHTKPSI